MVAETNTPLTVRNLNICSSHCHFRGERSHADDRRVHQIVNDSGYSRRVKIVMVQQSGPPHQRLSFVLAKLLDHDDTPRGRVASRRTTASRPMLRESREQKETEAERIP